MEAVQAVKPRVSFAAFQAARKPTLAQLIERYVKEMESTARPVGLSGRYTYKHLAASALGPIAGAALTDQDIITFCRARQAIGVKPCTTEKFVSCLVVVLKYAKAAWPDCKDIKPDVVKDVKPFLTKHNLISKSERRGRLPSAEEIERLVAYFNRPNPWHRKRIDMATITRWQVASSRRIGETCRLGPVRLRLAA